jgi:hypothetical protein
MLPVREYTSASEMLANYQRIRKTYRDAPPGYVVLPVKAEPAPPSAPAPEPPPAAYILPPMVIGPLEGVERRIMLDDVRAAVCRVFGISKIDITSDRRMREIVIPRQIAMALCKRLTGASLPAIGRAFGGRDHTTVLHAVRKMAVFIDYLPATDDDDPVVWATLAHEHINRPEWRYLRDGVTPMQEDIERIRAAKRDAKSSAIESVDSAVL